MLAGLVMKGDQTRRLGKTTHFHLPAVVPTAVRVVASSVWVDLFKTFARARRDFGEHARLLLLASLWVVMLVDGWA